MKFSWQVFMTAYLLFLVPPQPPSLPPAIGHRTTRKNRLRGTICGQCEVKTAGVVCAQTHTHRQAEKTCMSENLVTPLLGN